MQCLHPPFLPESGLAVERETAAASAAVNLKNMQKVVRLILVACLLGAPVLMPRDAASADPPRRVVSFNICADQLVAALAHPSQIAGLSPYATDPLLSAVAQQARAFRRIPWQAESVLPLEPDLVLVGPRDRSVTRRLLSTLGFRVVQVDFVGTIAGAREQIRAVADLLGQPERGEMLLARLDAARRRLASVPPSASSTALLVSHGGYAEGPASLAAGVLAEAGLDPPAGAPSGIGGFVALERLVTMRPDFLVMHDHVGEPRDQGSLFLAHPAVRSLYPPSRRLILPVRYTLCGGPGLVAGLDHLADELTRLATSTR
jgi:iron complex transport system substrate-binding protein